MYYFLALAIDMEKICHLKKAQEEFCMLISIVYSTRYVIRLSGTFYNKALITFPGPNIRETRSGSIQINEQYD